MSLFRETIDAEAAAILVRALAQRHPGHPALRLWRAILRRVRR